VACAVPSHVYKVASEEFGGLPTVFPERRLIKEEADQSMEWGEDPLGMEEQEPESIVPDQDEEEEGDISQESGGDSDDEQGEDQGAGKSQKYKELTKVEQSCGIRELYTIPEKNVIGPRLHAICRHILNTNILVSPLNQEYTENSHGHHSLVLGAWKTQLEERYKMKSGFWREEEDNSIKAGEEVQEQLLIRQRFWGGRSNASDQGRALPDALRGCAEEQERS